MNKQQYLYTVSVLMPAYNAAEHIREAIDSILKQTFSDFEFLIIDDGSTDSTVDIISEYNDPRIKLIENDGNKGLVYTLNKGLKVAQGKYIARMDADDISMNSRFEKQVNFLDKNPDVSILSTAFEFLGTPYHIHFPTDNEGIKVKLLENTALLHPGVMLRREVFIQENLLYNDDYKYAEDYHLWTLAAQQNIKMANLDEVLVEYRQHENQVSMSRLKEQQVVKERIQFEYLSFYFKDDLTGKELISVNSFFDIPFSEKISLLNKLNKLNMKYNYFDQKLFERHINILIYKNVLTDKYIPIKDLLKALKNGIAPVFLNTLIKINTKKFLKK